jgi:hypothetical protein
MSPVRAPDHPTIQMIDDLKPFASNQVPNPVWNCFFSSSVSILGSEAASVSCSSFLGLCEDFLLKVGQRGSRDRGGLE